MEDFLAEKEDGPGKEMCHQLYKKNMCPWSASTIVQLTGLLDEIRARQEESSVKLFVADGNEAVSLLPVVGEVANLTIVVNFDGGFLLSIHELRFIALLILLTLY